MTVRGKHGKPKAGFPPFPLPWEIPQNRRDFHIPTASATTIWTWTGPKTCPKPSTQGVGQNKLPNWAKCSCQTHLGGDRLDDKRRTGAGNRLGCVSKQLIDE